MERAGSEIVTRVLMQQAAISERGCSESQRELCRIRDEEGERGDCRLQQEPLHLSVVHMGCTPQQKMTEVGEGSSIGGSSFLGFVLIIIQLTSLLQESCDEIGKAFSESISL